METIFWVSLFAVAYPYVVYPAALVAWNRLARHRIPESDPDYRPTVSIILPVHDESARIGAKVRNLLALDYPLDRLQLIVIGDGCTDDTLESAAKTGKGRVTVYELGDRFGKAAALNAGLERVTGEIVVFTDAGIELEADALKALVGHFRRPEVGCVSGEDCIEGGGTEGLYGRLELLMRREEAKLHSIAGASGCFYGQRRSLCQPFVAGMAPDFLSVLVTVRAGYKAISEPRARGSMKATPSTRAEFQRKIRTFLRGLTALMGNAALLNPITYPSFSFILWSHKLLRWLAPVPLALCLLTSVYLSGTTAFAFIASSQVALWVLGAAALHSPAISRSISIARVSGFFIMANVAALVAVLMWLRGIRMEVWEPTRRPA